jgi:hypothetical protein
MIMPKGTPKKSRQVPSVERQLALALVALIEDVKAIPDDIETTSVIQVLKKSTTAAQKVLDANGYGGLESIESRIIQIEADIIEAVKTQDGAKLSILGAALERAKKGLPPLATEKKPRKKKVEPADTASTTPPAEKKKRGGKKDDKPALPLGEIVPVQCVYPGCAWKGEAVVDSACPVCSSAVVAAESEAK